MIFMIFRTLNSTTRAGNITSHEHGLYLLAREFVFGSDVLPTAVKLSLDFVVPFLHEGYVGGATTLRARASQVKVQRRNSWCARFSTAALQYGATVREEAVRAAASGRGSRKLQAGAAA